MSGLDDLIGHEYGPVPLELTTDRIGEFRRATGDHSDPGDTVPPLFANAALFAVAPRFLDDPAVVPFTRSLIHSEQAFAWARAAAVGETMQVVGRVVSARQRSGLNLVGFNIEARSSVGPWMTGSAQFVMSTEAAAGDKEGDEPPAALRPEVDAASERQALPEVGSALAPLRCGASRLDLLRYAAATRDWNPIHWDHHSAVAAGLSGTIVHGLLMAAWIGRSALRYASTDTALSSIAIRFRKPLRPSVAAVVTGTVIDSDDTDSNLDLSVEAEGDRLVTARARVTR